MLPFAEMLDSAYGGTQYADTLRVLRERIDHPELTPSAQVLDGIRQAGGFSNYSMALARQHQAQLLAKPLDRTTQAQFDSSVQESMARQSQLEAHEEGSFEGFVAQYYA
jgi:glutamate--cysteine ligase